MASALPIRGKGAGPKSWTFSQRMLEALTLTTSRTQLTNCWVGYFSTTQIDPNKKDNHCFCNWMKALGSKCQTLESGLVPDSVWSRISFPQQNEMPWCQFYESLHQTTISSAMADKVSDFILAHLFQYFYCCSLIRWHLNERSQRRNRRRSQSQEIGLDFQDIDM